MISRQLSRILPRDEQLPQRLPASPTVTDAGVTPAAAANSPASRDITASAWRFRKSSMRRE
jgi:hypothetical protein